MSIKRIAVSAAVVAVLALGMVATHHLDPATRVHVDQATCDRIQPGMTKADVEKIIGAPEGWYGLSAYNSKRPPKKGYTPTWVARTGEIVVEFDKDHRVASARFFEISDPR